MIFFSVTQLMIHFLKDFSDCGQIYRTRSITQICADSYDLIFSNTIANGWVLRDLEPQNVPVVTYVHENGVLQLEA